MEAIQSAIKSSQAYLCYECGKCTSNCPIAQFSDYSPRRFVGRVMQGQAGELIRDGQLWSCLTCGTCNVYCPSDVKYTEFMKDMRAAAQQCGQHGWCSHGSMLQTLMQMMASPALQQNRLEWVTDDMRTAEHGEYLYFVGCLPYFDRFFSNIGAESLATARSTVRILNALGIEPVLMKNERCCGHDLLWEGDVDNFMKLGELNLAEIKKSGAKKVIMSCSECTRTFKLDYADFFGKLGFEVLHLSELLAAELACGKLNLDADAMAKTVTYQDPCRLGRHLGIYEEPRQVITSIPGVELHEMSKNRKNSVCCGTSAWMNCDMHSKQIQLDRLQHAKRTGVETLVTTCPKCAIHYKCALAGNGATEEARIEIEDLSVLVAEALTD